MMWLLAWTINHGENNLTDSFMIHETETEARDAYVKLLTTDDLHSAAFAPIATATEPHWMEATDKPHTATIIFGEIASRLYGGAGGKITPQVEDEGNVESVAFATKPELDAFMEGVEMASGWLDHTVHHDSRDTPEPEPEPDPDEEIPFDPEDPEDPFDDPQIYGPRGVPYPPLAS